MGYSPWNTWKCTYSGRYVNLYVARTNLLQMIRSISRRQIFQSKQQSHTQIRIITPWTHHYYNNHWPTSSNTIIQHITTNVATTNRNNVFLFYLFTIVLFYLCFCLLGGSVWWSRLCRTFSVLFCEHAWVVFEFFKLLTCTRVRTFLRCMRLLESWRAPKIAPEKRCTIFDSILGVVSALEHLKPCIWLEMSESRANDWCPDQWKPTIFGWVIVLQKIVKILKDCIWCVDCI